MPSPTAATDLSEGFDPWDTSHLDDPLAVYERMREVAPMYWHPERGLWFATRFADVLPILKDHQRFGSALFHQNRPQDKLAADRDDSSSVVTASFGGTMMLSEPPEHTRLRKLQVRAFSARAMKRMHAEIEAIADELLDRVEGQDGMDAMADYAAPLPIIVISRLLGVPAEHEQEFLRLSVLGHAGADPLASPEEVEACVRARGELATLVAEIIEEKRSNLGEDLISTLITAEDEGEMMRPEELVPAVVLMMEAGHLTTVHLIGNGLELFLDDPSLIARVNADPELVRPAVEECLRYAGPVHFIGRTVLEDVEIGGQTLRAGQNVVCLLAAANRDPEQFDDPGTFRIDRTPNRHLAFGQGIHVCIGSALARVEAQVAFAKLFARHPGMRRAAPPGPPATTFELRGLDRLPVLF